MVCWLIFISNFYAKHLWFQLFLSKFYAIFLEQKNQPPNSSGHSPGDVERSHNSNDFRHASTKSFRLLSNSWRKTLSNRVPIEFGPLSTCAARWSAHAWKHSRSRARHHQWQCNASSARNRPQNAARAQRLTYIEKQSLFTASPAFVRVPRGKIDSRDFFTRRVDFLPSVKERTAACNAVNRGLRHHGGGGEVWGYMVVITHGGCEVMSIQSFNCIAVRDRNLIVVIRKLSFVLGILEVYIIIPTKTK